MVHSRTRVQLNSASGVVQALPDFEVIKVMTELLDELNIGEYEVKLNHRKLLDAMLDICGVPPKKFRTLCSSIDKLDKQSFEEIKKEISIAAGGRYDNLI